VKAWERQIAEMASLGMAFPGVAAHFNPWLYSLNPLSTSDLPSVRHDSEMTNDHHPHHHHHLFSEYGTSVYSALGVSAIMRYINRRFTYLLTRDDSADVPHFSSVPATF